jgi:hypothetical protein
MYGEGSKEEGRRKRRVMGKVIVKVIGKVIVKVIVSKYMVYVHENVSETHYFE